MPHRYTRLLLVAFAFLALPGVGTAQREPFSSGVSEKKLLRSEDLWRHRGALWTLTFTPDNRTLISAGADGFIRFWDVQSGNLQRRIVAHSAAIWSIAVARHGQLMASGSEDGSIALWELPSGELLRRIETKQGLIRGVALSPDGRTVASGGLDNTVCLWDAGSGKRLRQLEGHGERVTCVCFSPDGKLLASGSWDCTARIWDPASGKDLRRLEPGLKVLIALSFSPDSKQLLASSFDANPLVLWDAGTGKRVAEIALGSNAQTYATLSPDGRSVVAATALGGNAIHLWDSATGSERRRVQGLPAAVQCIALSPDGKRLASGDKDGTICLWDTESGRELGLAGYQADHGNFAAIWLAHGGPVARVVFSRDGALVATAGSHGDVRIWNSATQREVGRLDVGPASINDLCFAANGKSLAVACSDGSIRLHAVMGGWEVRRCHQQREPVLGIVFSADSSKLLGVGLDHSIGIWGMDTGKPIGSFIACAIDWPAPAWRRPGFFQRPPAGGFDPATDSGHCAATLSSDGRTLAFVDSSNRVTFRDVATGRPRHGAVEVGSELVTFVCYAPGGRSLAVGKRGRVEIWEIASRTRRAAFTGFDGAVNMVQFSADGRQLAAATNGRHAYVLDLATRKQAHQRLGQAHASGFRDQGDVNLVHIFPDGKVVSVASADDVLLLGEFPRLPDEKQSGPVELTKDALETSRQRLEAAEAWGVEQPLWQLVRHARQSVPFLVERLGVLQGPGVKEIPQLIRDLDNDQFAVRQRASNQLELLGELAEPALRRALSDKPSPEVFRRVEHLLRELQQGALPDQWLRVLRALEVLEQIGSTEARQGLESLSRNAANEWVRQEARSSLERRGSGLRD